MCVEYYQCTSVDNLYRGRVTDFVKREVKTLWCKRTEVKKEG